MRHFTSYAIAASLMLATSSVATAQLTAVVTESGKITMSVDGAGSNADYTVDVNKPAGATVRKAYLSAASNFDRVINDFDISLAGTPVDWDLSVFNNAGTFDPVFFNNVFGDVTAIVKPIIDAAGAGITSLKVVENGTFDIDGVVLFVIFDDPNQTAIVSAIIVFGGQDTTGDQFSVNLAEPIDTSDPGLKLDMGLGISFSFQGDFGTDMVSQIDVNGQRLTSSAGGEDDGEPANGALITAGGIGDLNTNPPDPFAGSTGLRTDDELYTLIPFVNDGDTTITVNTFNPTDDDNIFCGYFVVTGTASIGESIFLTPEEAENPTCTEHTVTATVVDDLGNPIVGRNVDFEILSGPNAGETGSDITDSNGQATFTWVGDEGVGTDEVVARMINSDGNPQESNHAFKTWVENLLFLGFNEIYYDIGGGDILHTFPTSSAFVWNIAKDQIPSFYIPNDPALIGFDIYFQVAAINPFASDTMKLSNGLDVKIGVDNISLEPASGIKLWSDTPPALGSVFTVNYSVD